MLTTLENYRNTARHAAYAHRVRNVPLATTMFALLWGNLNNETSDDRRVAREEFNATFKVAYRSQWEPGLSPAPSPAPLHCNEGRCTRGCADRCQGLGSRPDPHAIALKAVAKAIKPTAPRKSAALDCAAFYATKSA